jgi:magnesium chelatase subunit I
VIFKPDVKIIATANPVDYTHSGKIIEPLFDRLRSHISTHYPRNVIHEMLIIAQEIRIADIKNVFLPIFILRTLSKITQLARSHHEINHDKGVSVRMAVHSMEAMIGEAERTRSVLHYVKAVPRFCDIHSIHQSAKFELSEIEDNYHNRMNVLDSIIENAIKDVSLEYVQNLTPEQKTKLKNEFAKNKEFLVSQVILGAKGSDSTDYESQLAKFPSLKQIINDTIATVKEEQKEFVNKAKDLGINTESLSIVHDLDGEFTASVSEVILEGFRWIQPPLLNKKDNSYVSTY